MQDGRHVAVLGLGESGYQSALFLKKKGYEVWVSEKQESGQILARAEDLRARGIFCETGKHSMERLLSSDWVLISPGISPETEVYRALRRKGIAIVSEIEAASWFCSGQRVIAVTGSSGKTTVTTLLQRMFEADARKCVSCGNIGNPWIGEIDRADPGTFFILELSSFQLQHCSTFRPHVGINLNITPNHLDWHEDMAEYAAAKWNLFRNQTPDDFAFLREQDMQAFPPGFPILARRVDLEAFKERNPNEEVVRQVGGLFGIPVDRMEKVLRDFKGLEHRLELAGSSGGVDYVNDSKSTTTASLAWALEKFPDDKVILIAGGIAKSRDHGSLKDLIHAKVRQLILIGESADYLSEAWSGASAAVQAGSLQQAVNEASKAARQGDTVLLSPACSSFDMFKNYQERGREFKRCVALLSASSGDAAGRISV